MLGAACLVCVLTFESCFSDDMYRAKNGVSREITVKVDRNERYDTYKEACAANNYEAAHVFLDEYCNAYLKYLSKNPILYGDERTAAESNYYKAFDYIYNSELQYLMSHLGEEECKDKIVFLLNSVPVVGEVLPEGLHDYYDVYQKGDRGNILHAYITWTVHYNRLCNTVLTLAINRRYKSVAQTALMQYVDNVEATTGDSGTSVDGVSVDGNHGYVKYTTTDRDVAKRKYKEALQLGMFE